MGYGLEKPKSHKSHHRWMRYEKVGNPRLDGHAKPVLLRATLPSDFCCRCRVTREQLEVSYLGSNPRYLYQRNWEILHAGRRNKYNRGHPQRPNGNLTRTREQIKAWGLAEKIPIHPDHTYPTIFVTACNSRHMFVEKEKS